MVEPPRPSAEHRAEVERRAQHLVAHRHPREIVVGDAEVGELPIEQHGDVCAFAEEVPRACVAVAQRRRWRPRPIFPATRDRHRAAGVAHEPVRSAAMDRHSSRSSAEPAIGPRSSNHGCERPWRHPSWRPRSSLTASRLSASTSRVPATRLKRARVAVGRDGLEAGERHRRGAEGSGSEPGRLARQVDRGARDRPVAGVLAHDQGAAVSETRPARCGVTRPCRWAARRVPATRGPRPPRLAARRSSSG